MNNNIICPYCFHYIGMNNVVFRMKSGEKKQDEYLQYFETNKGNNEYSNNNYFYIDPAYVKEQEKVYSEKNFLIGIIDNNGTTLDVRLCPYCHNTLHKNFGIYENHTIAVLGFTSSGKTTYLAALHKQLEDCDIISKVNIGCNNTIDENVFLFANTEKKILRNKQSATVSFLGPFIYDTVVQFPIEGKKQLRNERKATFSFYDLPGESFKNAEEISKNAGYIGKSSGWIFLIDPENLRNIDTVFTSIYNVFIAQGNKNKAKIALVINKGDLLETIINIPEFFAPTAPRDYCTGQPIELSTIHNNSNEIRNTIVEKIDELKKIDKMVNGFCKDQEFNWFITSCVNNEVFNPMNCDEPFYWILAKLGLYPCIN